MQHTVANHVGHHDIHDSIPRLKQQPKACTVAAFQGATVVRAKATMQSAFMAGIHVISSLKVIPGEHIKIFLENGVLFGEVRQCIRNAEGSYDLFVSAGWPRPLQAS